MANTKIRTDVQPGRRGAFPLSNVLATIGFVVGLGWSASLMLRSPGTPVQDEIGHVLIARDAWIHPALVLDEWGRSANTLIYMVPALVSWDATRWFSLGLSAMTVFVTTRVAQRLGIGAAWAVPFLLWLQPWFASLAFVSITEVPFALVAILGWWLFLRGSLIPASLVLGLLPLLRHEGVILVGTWSALCVVRRTYVPGALTWAPILGYFLLSWLTIGATPFEVFLRPVPTQIYGSGSWLHYWPHAVAGVGIPILGLFVVGLARSARRPLALLTFAWFAAYLLVHVVVFRFGLFNSGGYWLFLMPLAPAFAVGAALGLDALQPVLGRFPGVGSNPAARYFGIAIVLGSVAWAGSFATPHRADREQAALMEAATWLRQEGFQPTSVYSTHVWLYLLLPKVVEPDTLWTDVPKADSLPPGSVIVWDRHYSARQGWDRRALNADPSWESLGDFGDGTAILYRRR